MQIVRRYRDIILYHPNGTFGGGAALTTVTIVVTNPAVTQILSDTDESYSLTFSPSLASATITAATVFGARHGLESFSQLVSADR